MTIQVFRDYMASGKPVIGGSDVHMMFHQLSQEALKITAEINGSYHSPEALKGVPAFDSQIEGINNASGENEEFGDWTGSSVNFTDYTAQKNNTTITDAIRQNVRLMNPMSFIGDGKTTVAPHWYIRHGARDRDTAFPVPVNFATKLQNAGKDVDFLLAWNRPHSGDYALDELFQWIAKITK